MGVRDDEIQRLVLYGKALGLKVIIYSKTVRGDDAAWSLDGSMIEVFAGPGTTKTHIILNLIHELGHHAWFIHEKDRLPDMKFDEAITRENLFKVETDIPTPKHLRKKIWDVEIAGTQFWDGIVKDTNIKIPKWKIEAAKEFDMWMYEMYYENGHFPKGKFRDDHYDSVQKKHKSS